MSLNPPQQSSLFDEYIAAANARDDAHVRRAKPATDSKAASVKATNTDKNKTLRLCVLGSGSGGNCSVVDFGRHAIFIDLGLGANTVYKRLRSGKLDFARIKAAFITHLDRDHFRPSWINTLLYRRIRLCLHRWHATDLQHIRGIERLVDAGLVELFDSERSDFQLAPGTTLDIRTVRLPHDKQGTTGFRIDTTAGSVGYATDLGSVPNDLIERFAGADLLAIESNYDPDLQRASNRPDFLKRRVMGKQGHLSNAEAFAAVRAIFDETQKRQLAGESIALPVHVALLHRSRQCNCPRIVSEVFAADARIAPRVTLSEQHKRTRWLKVGDQRAVASPPSQMSLAFANKSEHEASASDSGSKQLATDRHG